MADENDTAEEQQGGGGKKKLIIIAAVVLMLGGGAAAFFLMGGEEPPADGEVAEAEAQPVEEGDPLYHRLDPEFIVNLPPGGPAGMLQVSLQVMTRTPSVVDTIQANDPMLRHHLINLFEQQEAAILLTAEGKQALQHSIVELLAGKLKELKEPGEIRDVYFTQFVMQ